jgi:hypothetical protein
MNELRADRHLWLLAKRWYKFTCPLIEAIKIIQTDYSGVNVNNNHVLPWVLQRVDEIQKKDKNFRVSNFIDYFQPRSVKYMFEKNFKWDFETELLQACISALCLSHRDICGELGEIDPYIQILLDKKSEEYMEDK